jgi:hypothetical protein
MYEVYQGAGRWQCHGWLDAGCTKDGKTGPHALP